MIGPRIAALRKNARMSQAELALRLGVSPSAVGMYEQGRREPSAATLVELAQIFHVSTDYLLIGLPTKPEDTHTLTRVLEELVDVTALHLEHRKDKPFTRQELALLFAALLTET